MVETIGSAGTVTTANVIDESLLAQSPFFRAFRGRERGLVASLLRVRTVTAGELLFSEGEVGDMMYVVLEGALRVTATSALDSTVISTLGPGEAVGEMALLLGEPRSAACRAAVDTKIGGLAKDDFDALLAREPGLAVALGRLMAIRLRRANSMFVPPVLAIQMLALGDDQHITLGRDPSNQVVLSSPAVAPFQVQITREESNRYVAHNIDDVSGEPLVVNGRRTLNAAVADGDTLKIGPYRFILRETLGARDEGGGSVWLGAEGLSVVRGSSTLLHDISLTIRPSEFVAITGTSGAGKSTLLNALNGFRPATKGRVVINGVSLYDNLEIFRRTIGYVPQDDIVHSELTVARALHHTARLRLPSAPPAALERRITNTLRILGLADQRDQPIGSLSGGQRKRASIGVELITEPSLFCLDEPTSGLDPATEIRMMALLRQISMRGQTVIMVTHATETIGMCDRVIFLARGGYLAFAGTPFDALSHFGVDEFDAIYNLLDHEQTPAHWAEKFRTSPYAQQATPAGSEGVVTASSSVGGRTVKNRTNQIKQFQVLTQRYVEIMWRDTRTLTLIALQTPLIALLMWAVFPQSVFSPDPDVGSGRTALMVLFILVAAAIFFGASNASKELVKERAIFRRERLVNLRLAPYVLSKICVLGAIGAFQTVLLVALCAAGGLLPETAGVQMLAAMTGVLGLTFLAGTGLGLLLSAVASNPDFATSMVPLILLPQLIFSGVLVPTSQMSMLSNWLAQVAVAKWSFELQGRVTGLTDILRAQNTATANVLRADYQAVFAAAGWWPHVAVLVAFTLVFLIGSVAALEAKTRLA